MLERNYTVFNLNMAHKLTEMGFKYVGKQVNKNNPKYYVYFFQEEEGLEEAIKTLAAQYRK